MNTAFSFKSQPNAGKLINSLRHLGYTNYSAIADLVDNSWDAESTRVEILVRQRDKDPEIIIECLYHSFAGSIFFSESKFHDLKIERR